MPGEVISVGQVCWWCGNVGTGAVTHAAGVRYYRRCTRHYSRCTQYYSRCSVLGQIGGNTASVLGTTAGLLGTRVVIRATGIWTGQLYHRNVNFNKYVEDTVAPQMQEYE